MLYRSIEKVKEITNDQLYEIYRQYPDLKMLFYCLKEFRALLLKNSNSSLNEWLNNAEKLEIQELETFINGIRNDQDAVENAIRYSYSNGLAEGSVNKLKSIKRIMYGRCQFNLLRSKVLLLESLKNKNIN